MKVSLLAALAGAALSSAAMAQWTITGNLIDGTAVFRPQNSSMPTTVGSSAASQTSDFRLNGAASTDHTFSNWWWYRTANDTRENCISSPTGSAAVTRTLNGTNGVSWSNIQPQTTGGNSALRFALEYSVVDLDGAAGAAAVVITRLTVTNTGLTEVAGVNLFNYVDYLLNGQDGSDIIPAANAFAANGNRYVIVNDTAAPGLAMAHIGFGATGYGAGLFSAVGSQVGDAGVDNFADFNNGTAANDLSGVLQWNFGVIPAGGSASATSHLVIPTPGAASLVGLAGLLAARRRRA